jgi:hypothetical protein
VQLAGLDLRHVENVVDDAEQMVRRVADLVQALAVLRLADVALEQVGNVKLCSSSKVKLNDESGSHKQKLGSDLNIRPVSMDFLVQAGVGCFGMYARYSPQTLFEGGKGPEIHPVSIGLILHFDM